MESPNPETTTVISMFPIDELNQINSTELAQFIMNKMGIVFGVVLLIVLIMIVYLVVINIVNFDYSNEYEESYIRNKKLCRYYVSPLGIALFGFLYFLNLCYLVLMYFLEKYDNHHLFIIFDYNHTLHIPSYNLALMLFLFLLLFLVIFTIGSIVHVARIKNNE